MCINIPGISYLTLIGFRLYPYQIMHVDIEPEQILIVVDNFQ